MPRQIATRVRIGGPSLCADRRNAALRQWAAAEYQRQSPCVCGQHVRRCRESGATAASCSKCEQSSVDGISHRFRSAERLRIRRWGWRAANGVWRSGARGSTDDTEVRSWRHPSSARCSRAPHFAAAICLRADLFTGPGNAGDPQLSIFMAAVTVGPDAPRAGRSQTTGQLGLFRSIRADIRAVILPDIRAAWSWSVRCLSRFEVVWLVSYQPLLVSATAAVSA